MKLEEIEKACKNIGENLSYHFADVSKMIEAVKCVYNERFYRFPDIRKMIFKTMYNRVKIMQFGIIPNSATTCGSFAVPMALPNIKPFSLKRKLNQ